MRSAGTHRTGGPTRGTKRGDGMPAPLSVLRSPCNDVAGSKCVEELSGEKSFRERSLSVLATERLILRAPCFEDAKTIATLANERRIAENTLRIPHPYGLADAQSFITTANATGGEIVFLIARRGGARRAGEQPGLAPGAGKMRIPVDGRRSLSHPRARLIRAGRSFPSRPQAVGLSPRRQA